MPAMKIWAVSFASADVPRRSSITPRPTMSVHVTTAASGSTAVSFIGSKNGRSRDTPIATRNPAHIARPPIVGVGTTWSFRSEGSSIAPNRWARRRTTGVSPNVEPAATRNTIR